MKIVINIPDDVIEKLENGSFGTKYNCYDTCSWLMNGTPLESCEDYINRQTILDNVNRIRHDKKYYMQYADTLEDGKQMARAIERMIFDMPLVTPTRPKGEWIAHNDFNGEQYYTCSECESEAPNWEVDYKEGAFQTNFCPACGTEMKR